MRRVHLDRAPGRGTHTIRFALSQSHSPAESKRRQRYIERDGACAASFGNIGDTEEERDRRWGALAGFGVSRSRRIELGPGTAPNIKRPALARLLGSDDALPGGMEPSRIQYLSELDNDELVRRKISFRTRIRTRTRNGSNTSRVQSKTLTPPQNCRATGADSIRR